MSPRPASPGLWLLALPRPRTAPPRLLSDGHVLRRGRRAGGVARARPRRCARLAGLAIDAPALRAQAGPVGALVQSAPVASVAELAALAAVARTLGLRVPAQRYNIRPAAQPN